MATSEATLADILEQIKGDNIRAAKMFGEYTLYCDEKVVALIADDQLFLKITPASSAVLDSSHEAPAYPGAKPSLRVPENKLKDSAWLTKIVNEIAADLPAPKPKKSKKP